MAASPNHTQGDYLGALQAAGSTGRLPSPGAGQGAADYMTETVAEWAKSSSRTAEERRVAVAAAAAALGAFARHHLTGPPLPASANAFGCLGGAAAGDDRHADVQRALESNGEELIGRIAHADFLLLALCLLPLCRGGGHDDWPASADWWAARRVTYTEQLAVGGFGGDAIAADQGSSCAAPPMPTRTCFSSSEP